MIKKILFLCIHNSCRSQMAEGIINKFYSSFYEGYSAGTEPNTVNPDAIRVMAEIDVDLSKNTSKHIDTLKNNKFDFAVTLCDDAKEICPLYLYAKKLIHKSFIDPSTSTSSEEDKLTLFRSVRDSIFDWIKDTFDPAIHPPD